MEWTVLKLAEALITALIPGFLATWLGGGGCFIRIPMIMYFFNVPIKSAYCINQAVIALTTIPGVVEHFRSGHVYVRGWIIAAASAAVGALLGVYAVAELVPEHVLRILFGFVCIAMGLYIARSTLRMRRALGRRITIGETRFLEHGAKLASLMFLAGLAGGLSGSCGCIYFVPILIGLGYPMHIAIGTSSALSASVAGFSSSILTYLGFMHWDLMLAIGMPTLVASWFGAWLARRSPPWVLRLAYALSIIGVGLFVAIDAVRRLGAI